MGQSNIFLKDPQSVVDFKVDLSDWLQPGESIISITATATAGLTVDSSSSDATGVLAWISGGTVNEDYELTFQWSTDQGRTEEQTLLILVRNK